ncbi:hypothetical protein [Paracoccus sediminicola]|uniref:hypothetical protein n=1 Tax=Paracoccus sediminicola TaxID=3017783 RepID=UPI0022F011FE|nr:hypothetical protein [Paracoccus sediminicola]WBU57182.1 hypothetical protein PAF18_01675 [Paracoccus sediminicola]
MSRSRILSRDEVGRLRAADRILRDAERAERESREHSAKLEQDIVSEARLKAMRESARTAASLIARAEEAAEARLRDLEPELARLVAQTVRSILGDFEPEEASYLAARQALSKLRDHRRGRIFAAPEMAGPVGRAVDDLGENGPEILSVIPDPAMERGSAVLSSDRGSTEIGLDRLTAQALSPWERSNATGGQDGDGS